MAEASDIAREARERPFERVDVRAELDKFERMLEELKVQYEQYFLAINPIPPEKAHNDLKRFLRLIRKTPLKSSALSYRMKMLDSRYQTYHTYWQRTLKQREEGTYSKDVFKANMRDRFALEDARAQTSVGAAEKSFRALFNAYKQALEQNSGQSARLDFDAFQKNLIQRAKDFKEQTGAKKVSFKVVMKEGKVAVQVHGKDQPTSSS